MQVKEKNILPFFKASLLATLFLFMVKLATGNFFYLQEAALACYGISFLLLLGKPPINLKEKWKGNYCFFILLAMYILWDLFTLFYSPAREHFMAKYKVVIMMAAIAASFFLVTWDRGWVRKVLAAAGSAGVAVALLTLLNYTVLHLFPLYYTRRLSLRADYNMFASVLFFSFIILFFLITTGQGSCSSMLWKISLLAAAELPVLILSGSRRYFVLLFPVALVLAGDFIWLTTKRKEATCPWWKAAAVLTVAAAVVFCLGLLYGEYLKQNEAKLQALPQAQGFAQGEALPQERYSTMAQAGQTSKRKLIWQTVIRELNTFTGQEWLIGRGFCYDNYFLRCSKSLELMEAYPQEMQAVLSAHSFWLADLLNGGIVKLFLAAALWLCIGAKLFFLLKREPYWGQLYWACFLTILLNNTISNRYGFLYDKMFWLFCLLLCGEEKARVIRK